MGKHEFFSGKRVKKAIRRGDDKGQRAYRLQAMVTQQAVREKPEDRRQVDRAW